MVRCIQARGRSPRFKIRSASVNTLVSPRCDIREVMPVIAALHRKHFQMAPVCSQSSQPWVWSISAGYKVGPGTECYSKAVFHKCSLTLNCSKLEHSEDMPVPLNTSKEWCRSQGTQGKVFPSLQKQCSVKSVRLTFSHTHGNMFKV